MTYFLSDSHFNHKGSLKWPNGKGRSLFESVEEMNQLMIDNWNRVVTENDEVYFLGDFGYKCNKQKLEEIFWQLHGKKHLIKGNHDFELASTFKNCWESISDIKQFDFINDKGCKQEIILCHYPMESWRHKEQGSWHLHGHVHGSMQELNETINRYDCSVEVNDYTPISLDKIVELFKNKNNV